jgi:hypothetical protein
MAVSARRRWLAVATAALLSAAAPTAAAADELTITAQAVAAHGEFLTQAPPPPTQGVLCLVDSGVDLNPDTEPILVGRESIYGGTLDDVTSYHHGTYVTMVAGAPANGWGMVGAWPGLKVLSVRALADGNDRLEAESYREGILRCVRAKTERGIDVRAVELALGGPADELSPADLAKLQEVIAYGRSNDIAFVSAAGNDGGPLNAPASVPDVIAIAAGDGRDGLCDFSSRGPGVDLVALGCQMDVVSVPSGGRGFGQSSSLASAYVAGIVVALRSYRPALSPDQAAELLTSTARLTPNGRVLDVSSAFRASGLGSLVESYRPPLAPPKITATLPCNPRHRVCVTLRVLGTRRAGRRIVIHLARIPRGVGVSVNVDGRRGLRTHSRVLRLRLRRWHAITIRFTSRGLRPSKSVRVLRSKLR